MDSYRARMPFLNCGSPEFLPVIPSIPPPQISFQQNQPVPFTNFPPPSLQCSPATFPNRPPFHCFDNSSSRPISVGNDSVGTINMNSQPFQFRIDKPPPLRPEVSFPGLPAMHSSSFRPVLDRPPPTSLNFSTSGSSERRSGPTFNPQFNQPAFFPSGNQTMRPEPIPSVSPMHPRIPSMQMTQRFPSGSTFKHRFLPNYQKPHYSQRSPNITTIRTCETSYENDSFNQMKRKRYRNFKGKEYRKIKDHGNDNTEKPFSCDTCDRAFASHNELNAHLSEHVKCNAHDCNFEAHPKIVALHRKMQHDTGYAAAINKLQNAEEIEKWRAERRKRFPTIENIKKKKAEQAEKEARGEILETKEFGKFKRRNFEQKDLKTNRFSRIRRRNSRFSGRKNFSSRENKFQRCESVTIVSSDSDDDSHIHLKKFCGLPSLENCIIIDDDKEDSEIILSNSDENLIIEFKQESSSPVIDKIQSKIKSRESLQSSAILSNGSISGEVIDLDNQRQTSIRNSVSSVETIRIEDSEDDPPEEIPIRKDPSSINLAPDSMANVNPALVKKEDEKSVVPVKNVNKQEKFQRNTVRLPKKSSLLEKLLADDIRHERNVILQCIHYIVKNNYFGLDYQNVK